MANGVLGSCIAVGWATIHQLINLESILCARAQDGHQRVSLLAGELTNVLTTLTGGKGSLTLQVWCEFIVSSETICPHFTHQFALKEPAR